MNYIKQLDSIRAIALLLVVASHWLFDNPVVLGIQAGRLGVDTFFVLSGFLISSILLKNRDEIEVSGGNRREAIKNFFIRRGLRIFPIYYLTIFIMFAFGGETHTHIKDNFIYFLTYTSNFYFYKNNSWDGMLSHLWSLAVEEQFYLIWPWVILFIPRERLLAGIMVFIGVGAAANYIFRDNFDLVLPFTCFDAFGIGALLAFAISKGFDLDKIYPIVGIAAATCVVIMLNSILRKQMMIIPARTAHSVIALFVIIYIINRREKGQEQFFILNSRILIFLGKISYAMYLYHLPLSQDSFYLNKYINQYLPDSFIRHQTYILFAENFLLLVALSWLSWVLIERPILKLKHNFEYQRPALDKLA